MKMVSLLKSAKKQPYLNMFKKKQNNKGVIWASFISIGVSTLIMMLTKGRRGKVTSSLQNITKNFSVKDAFSMMNNKALTEFSEEFTSNKSHEIEKGKTSNNAKGLTEFSDGMLSKDIPANGEISNMDDAALTEFSEDLMSKALGDK